MSNDTLCDKIKHCIAYLFSWEGLAPLMQTELARLSVFMSLAGYAVVFSDLLFSSGLPSFERLLGSSSSETLNTNYFLLDAPVKWRCAYFAFVALFLARICFTSCRPTRLEHELRKIDFIQSMKSTHIRSEFEAMFNRVTPSESAAGWHDFDHKRQEFLGLYFPEFDMWAKILAQSKSQHPQRQDHSGETAQDEKAPDQQEALQAFLDDCLEKDYQLAILERIAARVIVGIASIFGYCLLAIPALDLLQAAVRASIL